MKESTSKEKILKKIRNALINETPKPFTGVDFDADVCVQPEKDMLDVTFAEEFGKVGGRFVYCEDVFELKNNLATLIQERNWESVFCMSTDLTSLLETVLPPLYKQDNPLLNAQVAITRCEYLVARVGGILVSSALDSGRRSFCYPPVHIVVAYTSQLVPDIKDALHEMKEKYHGFLPSSMNLITGPSRTADIEKTLVMGAHGPKELFVFLVEDTNV